MVTSAAGTRPTRPLRGQSLSPQLVLFANSAVSAFSIMLTPVQQHLGGFQGWTQRMGREGGCGFLCSSLRERPRRGENTIQILLRCIWGLWLGRPCLFFLLLRTLRMRGKRLGADADADAESGRTDANAEAQADVPLSFSGSRFRSGCSRARPTTSGRTTTRCTARTGIRTPTPRARAASKQLARVHDCQWRREEEVEGMGGDNGGSALNKAVLDEPASALESGESVQAGSCGAGRGGDGAGVA